MNPMSLSMPVRFHLLFEERPAAGSRTERLEAAQLPGGVMFRSTVDQEPHAPAVALLYVHNIALMECTDGPPQLTPLVNIIAGITGDDFGSGADEEPNSKEPPHRPSETKSCGVEMPPPKDPDGHTSDSCPPPPDDENPVTTESTVDEGEFYGDVVDTCPVDTCNDDARSGDPG